VSRTDLKINDNYDEVNRSLTNVNSNIVYNNNQTSINKSDLNNFDASLKNFIQFKSNGTTINEAIFKYQFEASPNLSLDILRNINIASGMTVQTDDTKINNNFKVCDSTTNCMDMNIDNEGLNIFPTTTPITNNVSNIFIYDKTKTNIIAKFDLQNKGIYLGGDDENAGMFIKNNNVYLKNINIVTSFNGDKNDMDKTKLIESQPLNANNYKFDLIDVLRPYKEEAKGTYTIIRGTQTPPQNIIIFNFVY
jgi:hypothetical protein